ncbi:MAG: carboxypeptidase-like regulatory domain-containing protein [Planctomycetota bacterium]
MKSYKFAIWSLLALAATEIPAQAAWNNVFQPTCFGRNRRTTSNYCQSCAPVVAQFAPPAAPACTSCNSAPVMVQAPPPPVQQCTTNYIQRSFYQPVTTYESRSYYEPVTTMQTSFYYEAVTSMQTSFYPDPCSCGYIAKSCPVTAYQLKQQSCPVQSWVQRCAQVPVTSYKQVTYLEPQTSCCNTVAPCPTGACPPGGACQGGACQQAPAAPQSPSPSYSSPPIINQPTPAPQGPSVNSMSHYSPVKTASAWQPVVNLTGIAPEKKEGGVQGQVVRNDRTPTSNTQVLFVNATTGDRHSITTNEAGRFNLALSSGAYHVYLAGSNGSAAYHSQVNVNPNQPIHLINN